MVDRETKVISAILFATFLSLVGAHYFDSIYFVDWADVEKTAEYDHEAIIGDTVQIRYYFVNPKSHDIKIEARLQFGLSIYYASNPDERITTHVTVNRVEKYITVPAMSEKAIHTETVTATQLGTLRIQVSGLPEAEILVLPEGYNYTPWHSEPPTPWDGADLLPVETVVNDWREKGMNVCLPQYLPNQIEPLGARILVMDEGLASSAVFVFSAYNRTDLRTAEITMGVREGYPSFEKNKSWGMYFYVDGISVSITALIELPVEVRYSDYLELYGPYSTCVQMEIGSMYYWMRVEPSILLDDIKKIILSMMCVPLVSETPFNVVIELNKYVFDSQDTAKLVITNKDSHEITWGSPYTIEKQIEGEWVEVSPFPWPFAWTSECRFLPAWEMRRENIKIDHLENGHYRVSKTINHERTKTELTFTLEFDILPEYNYVMELDSEPHLVKGGNCYYTIDITMLNDGVSDINVKLENVRICDITHANMTVDEIGYDIVPDYAEYVLVPVNGTQSIRYVTGEVVHGSISYVRIEFTLHIHELDKIEIVSTWLHRKLVTS